MNKFTDKIIELHERISSSDLNEEDKRRLTDMATRNAERKENTRIEKVRNARSLVPGVVEKVWDAWFEARNLRPAWDIEDVRNMKKFYMVKEAEEQQLAAETIVRNFGWIGFQLDETNGRMRKATSADSASGKKTITWAMQRGASVLSTVLSANWTKASRMGAMDELTGQGTGVDKAGTTGTGMDGSGMGSSSCQGSGKQIVKAVRNTWEMNSRTLLMDDAKELLGDIEDLKSFSLYAAACTILDPLFERVEKEKSKLGIAGAISYPVVLQSDWCSSQCAALLLLLHHYECYNIAWIILRCVAHIINNTVEHAAIVLSTVLGKDEGFLNEWMYDLVVVASLIRFRWGDVMTRVSEIECDVVWVSESHAAGSESWRAWRALVAELVVVSATSNDEHIEFVRTLMTTNFNSETAGVEMVVRDGDETAGAAGAELRSLGLRRLRGCIRGCLKGWVRQAFNRWCSTDAATLCSVLLSTTEKKGIKPVSEDVAHVGKGKKYKYKPVETFEAKMYNLCFYLVSRPSNHGLLTSLQKQYARTGRKNPWEDRLRATWAHVFDGFVSNSFERLAEVLSLGSESWPSEKEIWNKMRAASIMTLLRVLGEVESDRLHAPDLISVFRAILNQPTSQDDKAREILMSAIAEKFTPVQLSEPRILAVRSQAEAVMRPRTVQGVITEAGLLVAAHDFSDNDATEV